MRTGTGLERNLERGIGMSVEISGDGAVGLDPTLGTGLGNGDGDANIPASEVWVGNKARIVGQTVSIIGYQTFYLEQSREFVVRLPASVSRQAVSVVWVNPDGSQVTVPITK